MKDIDSLSDENKDLLNIEEWDEVLRNSDQDELSREMEELQENLQELNKKVNFLIEVFRTR